MLKQVVLLVVFLMISGCSVTCTRNPSWTYPKDLTKDQDYAKIVSSTTR